MTNKEAIDILRWHLGTGDAAKQDAIRTAIRALEGMAAAELEIQELRQEVETLRGADIARLDSGRAKRAELLTETMDALRDAQAEIKQLKAKLTNELIARAEAAENKLAAAFIDACRRQTELEQIKSELSTSRMSVRALEVRIDGYNGQQSELASEREAYADCRDALTGLRKVAERCQLRLLSTNQHRETGLDVAKELDTALESFK